MKIIFVYNADSGFVNSLLDIGHKVIAPKRMCAISVTGLMDTKVKGNINCKKRNKGEVWVARGSN